jgi:hypothetical protein
VTREAEETQDTRQQKLLKKVHEQGAGWALVRNRSSRAVIQDILGMLRPAPARAGANGAAAGAIGSAARVYVLCDPKTVEDAERARQIQAAIRDRENMQVDLPPLVGADGATPLEKHQEMLRECDGLLLYRKRAPAGWLFQTFPDVIFAERLVDRPPVRSKAFLVNDPSLLPGIAGVPVIAETGDFQLHHLEPFLAPLRRQAVHAGI